MVYLETVPSPALRSWVQSLWYCHVPKMPRGRERVFPNGCMQIILNLSRDYLLRVKHLSIAECARSIGISERWLSQLFREEVCVSPKLWARIQRFQAVTRAMHAGIDIPWVQLALNCGYYDQSHFADDFRAFSGLDASAYSKHVNRWQNHVTLD
jgi:AraC-like DNA-binding protein